MNIAPATSSRAASAATVSRPIDKELINAANGVRDAAQVRSNGCGDGTRTSIEPYTPE